MIRRRALAERRAVLVGRCELQRRDFEFAARGVAPAFHAIDAAVVVGQRARQHPLLATGIVVAAIVVFRPGRFLRVALAVFSAAVTVRRLSAQWRYS